VLGLGLGLGVRVRVKFFFAEMHIAIGSYRDFALFSSNIYFRQTLFAWMKMFGRYFTFAIVQIFNRYFIFDLIKIFHLNITIRGWNLSC
jgi:hypothetical protein